MKILMNFKENYPNLCSKEIEELMANFDDKDWKLYHAVENGQENAREGQAGIGIADNKDKFRKS